MLHRQLRRGPRRRVRRSAVGGADAADGGGGGVAARPLSSRRTRTAGIGLLKAGPPRGRSVDLRRRRRVGDELLRPHARMLRTTRRAAVRAVLLERRAVRAQARRVIPRAAALCEQAMRCKPEDGGRQGAAPPRPGAQRQRRRRRRARLCVERAREGAGEPRGGARSFRRRARGGVRRPGARFAPLFARSTLEAGARRAVRSAPSSALAVGASPSPGVRLTAAGGRSRASHVLGDLLRHARD